MRRITTVAALFGSLILAGACGSAQQGETEAAERTRSVPAAASAAPDTTPGTAPRRPAPDRAWVIFGSDTVVAEVARTPDERAQGLMYREELPDGTGMLFVFPDEGVRSFWMNNTYVALDIAYMDAAFRVVDVQRMEPNTTAPHESAAPAMFALEVPAGWFAAHGVTVGAVPDVRFGARVGG